MVENGPSQPEGWLKIENAKARMRATACSTDRVETCEERNPWQDPKTHLAGLGRLGHLGLSQMVKHRGDYWQNRLKRQCSAQYTQRPWMILVSKKPVSAALTLSHVQLGLTLMMLASLFLHPHDSFLVRVKALLTQEEYSQFRVLPVQNQSSLIKLHAWGIVSEGYLFPDPDEVAGECRIESGRDIKRFTQGGASYLAMDRPMVADGIYLLLSGGGDAKGRSGSFVFEGSKDGTDWNDLRRSGGCGSELVSGRGRMVQEISDSKTCDRDTGELMQMQISGYPCNWMEYMEAGKSLVSALSILIVLILSRLEQFESAVKVVGLGSILWSVIWLWLYWRYEWENCSKGNLIYALQALGILMFFPGPLLFSEVVAFEALLVCALYMCLCVYGLTGQISISAVMLLAIGIALLVARKWIQRRARSWLTKDMKAYESVFIKGKDQIVAYLDSLSESISTLNLCRNECNLPRQLPGVVDDFVYGMGSKSFSQYLTVQIADNKVKSLDQLFMQAIVLHDMFRSKVEGICSALCGVSVQPPPDGIFLTDFERCLEKAVVTCEGEASRLVDVLRARLVCRDWGCVRSCIQRIAEDSELQVIRVKNRFDRSYDPRQTGGYRDVCLNVCLVTDETWTLGVSGHVCELQLALGDFKMRSNLGKGHARYVSYRNLRCE